MFDKQQCEVVHAFLTAHALKSKNDVVIQQADEALRDGNLGLLERLKNGVLGDELHELQKPHNNGRGVSCVRGLVADIHRGDYTGAYAAATHDWDKIANYRDIAEWLKNNKIVPDEEHYYISSTAS